MTDAARRAYLTLGRGFVLLGVAIAAVSIVDALANLGFFRGSPLGTAVFVTLVGVALLWTVRQADAQRAAEAAEAADAPAEADASAGAPPGADPRAARGRARPEPSAEEPEGRRP